MKPHNLEKKQKCQANNKKTMKKLIFILCVLALVGCRSKKKIVEREQIKTEIKTEVKKEENTQKDVKIDSSVNSSKETITLTTQKAIELTQGDPNKEIVVIDHTGKKTSYKGANVVIRDIVKIKKEIDTLSSNLSKTDNSTTSKTESVKTEEKTESKKRSTDTKVKTTPTIIGVGIGLGVVGLIIFFYLRRKKRQFTL